MISQEEKAKIKWQCRRGMLELDIIFQRFYEAQIDHLSQERSTAFQHLLTYPDPFLFAWLMGYETPINKELTKIVAYIRSHDNA